MLRAKNYQNRSMFYGVIHKIKVAQFFETWYGCIFSTLYEYFPVAFPLSFVSGFNSQHT